MTKVAIDYGHGGSDPGAVSGKLREKDLVLQIGRKITALLKKQGIQVVETRTSDVFVSLANRTRIANNANVDLLISIHVNSASSSSANGVETFSFPSSTKGAQLAKAIQDELIKLGLFNSNRGVKTANFHVLRASSMPSALVELGFIKNAHDVKIMTQNQDKLAQAVANGILKHLGKSAVNVKQGWIKESNIWYYYKGGKKHKGWIKLNDLWYYLNSRGELQTRWFQTATNGPWYYSDSGGRMQTGWLKDDGRWFYLNKDGSMHTGLLKDKGKFYFFNLGGRMTTDQFFTLFANEKGEVYYK